MLKFQVQHRIFVVDDEPTIASTLALILSQQGFEVTPFTDPLQALRAIQTAPPDLVIADVVMPGLSGIELAIVIRDTYPDCAVLLFSGQIATAAMLEMAKGRGYNFEVLAKPIHPVEMLERVRMGLGLGSHTDGATAIF
ncbi:MAG: response regulator [Terracidiphilus sp.]